MQITNTRRNIQRFISGKSDKNNENCSLGTEGKTKKSKL